MWDTSQLYINGRLSVVGPANLAGDYNQNGTVDAADYVVWRNGLGTTYTQDHYDIWRANFGSDGRQRFGCHCWPRQQWSCHRARTGNVGVDARRSLPVGIWEHSASRSKRSTGIHFCRALGRMNKAATRCTIRVGVPVLLSCCLSNAAGTALGQTLWVNPGLGDWSTPGNWSLGVPDSASGTAFDAVIENGGMAQFSHPAAAYGGSAWAGPLEAEIST